MKRTFWPIKDCIRVINKAYTGRGLKHTLHGLGFDKIPANTTQMYLNGESAQYIYAAALAVNTIGE